MAKSVLDAIAPRKVKVSRAHNVKVKGKAQNVIGIPTHKRNTVQVNYMGKPAGMFLLDRKRK